MTKLEDPATSPDPATSAAAAHGSGPVDRGSEPTGSEHLADAPELSGSGASTFGSGRRSRHVGRLVVVVVIAALMAMLVADVLIGRLAFTTRQDHWAGIYNDPTVKRPDRGAPTMVLQVEDLGVNLVVAEGSSADVLRGGPGLMTGSPLPGDPGNAVILGRSSRFGAPFGFLNDVAKGAVIVVRQQAGGVARFEVEKVRIVDPDQFEKVVGKGVSIDGASEDTPSTLTLVSSVGGPLDSRRRVVTAKLTGRSAAGAVPTADGGATKAGADMAASTTTTVAGAAGGGAVATQKKPPTRDPGKRPDTFDVRSPATVLLLVGGLVIAALGVAAVPELRRRHPTSTVVMVAAPAIALGAVMVLFSLDAVLPVTY